MLATVGLVLATIVVIAVFPAGTLIVAIAEDLLIAGAWGGAIGGIISTIKGVSFWEGFKDEAFFGAIAGGISGGMEFLFIGAVKAVSMTLK